MEAPEKIYITSFEENPPELDRRWYYAKQVDCYNTEYTRTDAFIEKACKWLKENVNDYTDDGCGERSFVLVHDIVSDFKKHMKG